MFGLFERKISNPTTQTQTSAIDPGMMDFRGDLFDYGRDNILDQSFQGYTDQAGNPLDRFAGFNMDQNQAMANIRRGQNFGSGSYQGAIDASQKVASMGSPELQYQSFLNMGDPSRYMNPYTQNVINPAVQGAQDDLTRQLNQITSDATKLSPAGRNEGEFLERGVARAEGAKNIGALQANLLNKGFSQAQGMMERDIGRGDQYGFKQAGLDLSTTDRNLKGSANVANIMDRYRNARRGDTRDLMGIGNQQQGQNQQDLDFAYQEFMREQGDPMMRLGAVQGLLGGPYGKTSTGTTNQTMYKDDLADLLGLGAGVVGGLGSGGFFN
tara:strand:- start:2832 stop:3809 length:978 start_codon:yes stop_codon:yes gene_type:complete